MNYAEWNAALSEHFVGPAFAGKPVYLRVDDDELRLISGLPDAESARSDFCAAVRGVVRGDGTFESFRKNSAVFLWLTPRKPPASTPPIVGLLAAAVLAGSDMANDPAHGISAGAYYPRLCEILALREVPNAGRYHLRDWWVLFNEWLDSVHRGAFGISTARPISYSLIGYPLSQLTLRREDRLRLPDFFRWCRLEPQQLIDEQQLIDDFAYWVTLSRCSLTPFTVHLLHRLLDREEFDGTGQDLVLEYERWDGSFREKGGATWTELQLQAGIVREHRRVALQLVGRRPNGFPTGMFLVEAGAPQSTVEVHASEEGYYEPLGIAVQAQTLASGLALRQGSFQLKFLGDSIHVLEQNLTYGDWVTVDQVTLAEPCMVLTTSPNSGQVERVLSLHARSGWHRIGSTGSETGLPAGWVGYCCVHFDHSYRAYEGLEELSPRQQLDIIPQYGLAFTADCWMKGALPQLAVSADDAAGIQVLIDDRVLGERPPPFALDLNAERLEEGEHKIRIGTRSVPIRVSRQAPPDARNSPLLLGWTLDLSSPSVGALMPEDPEAPRIMGAVLNPTARSLASNRLVAVYPGHAIVGWIGSQPGQLFWLQERALLDELAESVLDMRPPPDFDAAWLYCGDPRSGQHVVMSQHHPPPPVVVPPRDELVVTSLKDLGPAFRSREHIAVKDEDRASMVEWATIVAKSHLASACKAGENLCRLQWDAYKRVAANILA